MEHFFKQIRIQVDEGLCIKDPEQSELGLKMLSTGATLIDELGLEQFTFRKLANEIQTFESTIYRYFENKHKFLLYLTSLYWGWKEYQLVLSVSNIQNPEEKLKKGIETLLMPFSHEQLQGGVSLELLQRIMMSESNKAYLNRMVDQENKSGCFKGYLRIHERFSELIRGLNPTYPYPMTLASNVLEGMLWQQYVAEHLPSLTDAPKPDARIHFFTHQILSTLKTAAE